MSAHCIGAGYNHLTSNKREWINCFIKTNHGILLDLADFALQKQPEDNLMVTIAVQWYNGSNTMAATSIKPLKLHYTMIQSYHPTLPTQSTSPFTAEMNQYLHRLNIFSTILLKELIKQPRSWWE